LRRNPACIFWVWRYCYQHKATDTGRGIYNTTASISAAARHLADEKPGHSILAPGKTPKLKPESSVYSALMAGKLPVSQAVANQLSGFNNQRFMRLYDYLLPLVLQELSQAVSKVHLSFDGWTTKGGKKGFVSIVAHYVKADGKLCDLPIALPQLTGCHTSERMAEVVLTILQKFCISPRKVGYFMLNNASNNDSKIQAIAQKPE
jgi:hypothetical protein